MKHEIFGISFDKCENLIDEFESYYDFCGMIELISKKTYEHGFECKDEIRFKYKYVIEAMDSEAAEGRFYLSVYLVPTFDSLAENHKKDVRQYIGDELPNVSDVKSYGLYVLMVDCSFEEEPTEENMEKRINEAANVIEVIDRLRGFHLDKPQTSIGTTGWDYLNDYINNKDFLEASISRFESA